MPEPYPGIPGRDMTRVMLMDSVRALREDSKMLRSLLSVLHRDGGQYQINHGTEKACLDAKDQFYRMVMTLEFYSDEARWAGVLEDRVCIEDMDEPWAPAQKALERKKP